MSAEDIGRLHQEFEGFLGKLPHRVPTLRGGPPDWISTVDTDAESGNPELNRVEELIECTPRLNRLRKQWMQLVSRFRDSLPEDLVQLWLQVEEAYNLRDCVHVRIGYNLGVEAGRNMVTVEAALKNTDIDTTQVGQEGLFALSVVLARLAEGLRS
jgi:hypothetical protein